MANRKKKHYSLWTIPYSEWSAPLKGLKIDHKAIVDEKKLIIAMEGAEKLFECFKPRPVSIETLLRPICDHD
jgi:hypothetical protein